MTSQVSTAELRRLQTDAARWFTEQATLQRIAVTATAKGGRTNTRTIIWTGKVGRKPMSESGREAMENVTGDLATQISHWVFSLPAGVNVLPQDEIVASGRTYQVVGGIDKSLEIARYVIAVEQR